MASVLHGSARTTPCLRAEFQASQESTRSLAARYGVNAKTVKKWRSRTTTADAPMGPKTPKSTVLTPAVHRCLQRHGISRLGGLHHEYCRI
jgi:transposase-like protein